MSIPFTCEKCGGSSYEQFSQTQVMCLHCGAVGFYDTGYKVEKQFELSGDANLLDFVIKQDYVIASLSKRLLNYIIDTFFILFIIGIIQYSTNSIQSPYYINDDIMIALLLLIFPVYYIVLEYKFGKTIGKIFTKTKVISTKGNELTFGQSAARFFCRIIPFERFSAFFSNGVFWHDSIPKTLVIEDQ